MRCKKHLTDLTSSVGVCASCLRERLIAVIAAQIQAQRHAQNQQDRRKSETQHVSPYISHRKSDSVGAWQIQGDHKRFFSTPQVGPTGLIAVESKKGRKSNGGRFSSIFSGLFRSKSDPDPDRITEPRVSESCSASPWFAAIIPGSRKNRVKNLSLENSARKTFRDRDRGMSPEKSPEEEHCRVGSNGYSSESYQCRRNTPRKTPAMRCTGEKATGHGRNSSGLAFCLSPLVRTSPNLSWNQSGVPPEIVVSGQSRVTAKPHLSTQPSFCKNRSRKIAEFGRNSYRPFLNP